MKSKCKSCLFWKSIPGAQIASEAMYSIQFAPSDYTKIIDEIFVSSNRMLKDVTLFDSLFLNEYVTEFPPIVCLEEDKLVCIGNHMSLYILQSAFNKTNIEVIKVEDIDKLEMSRLIIKHTIFPSIFWSAAFKSRFVHLLIAIREIRSLGKYLRSKKIGEVISKLNICRPSYYRIIAKVKHEKSESGEGLAWRGGENV